MSSPPSSLLESAVAPCMRRCCAAHSGRSHHLLSQRTGVSSTPGDRYWPTEVSASRSGLLHPCDRNEADTCMSSIAQLHAACNMFALKQDITKRSGEVTALKRRTPCRSNHRPSSPNAPAGLACGPRQFSRASYASFSTLAHALNFMDGQIFHPCWFNRRSWRQLRGCSGGKGRKLVRVRVAYRRPHGRSWRRGIAACTASARRSIISRVSGRFVSPSFEDENLAERPPPPAPHHTAEAEPGFASSGHPALHTTPQGKEHTLGVHGYLL